MHQMTYRPIFVHPMMWFYHQAHFCIDYRVVLRYDSAIEVLYHFDVLAVIIFVPTIKAGNADAMRLPA